jgi:hypothetical protein
MKPPECRILHHLPYSFGDPRRPQTPGLKKICLASLWILHLLYCWIKFRLNKGISVWTWEKSSDWQSSISCQSECLTAQTKFQELCDIKGDDIYIYNVEKKRLHCNAPLKDYSQQNCCLPGAAVSYLWHAMWVAFTFWCIHTHNIYTNTHIAIINYWKVTVE